MYSYGSNKKGQLPSIDSLSPNQVMISYAGYNQTISVIKSHLPPPISERDISFIRRSNDIRSSEQGLVASNGAKYSYQDKKFEGNKRLPSLQRNSIEMTESFPLKQEIHIFGKKIIDSQSRLRNNCERRSDSSAHTRYIQSFNENSSSRIQDEFDKLLEYRCGTVLPPERKFEDDEIKTHRLTSSINSNFADIQATGFVAEKYFFNENINTIHVGDNFAIAVTNKSRRLWIHGTNTRIQAALYPSPSLSKMWNILNLNSRTRQTRISGKEYIKHVACGKNFVLIVVGQYCDSRSIAKAGHDILYSFGENTYGQLGYKSEGSQRKANWTPVKYMSPENTKYDKLAISGSMRTLNEHISHSSTNINKRRASDIYYTSDSKKIPSNQQNSSEAINSTNIFIEKVRKSSAFRNIEKVACGSTFSVIVTHGGIIYTCGDNSKGQCGLGYISEKSIPFKKVIFSSKDSGIKSSKIALNSILYPGSKSTLNSILSSKKCTITHLACGSNHTVICQTINNKQKIFSWGYNKYGQCSVLNEDGTTKIYVVSPTEIYHPLLNGIKNLACGGNSTVILTQEDKILVCGSNNQFQLCQNSSNTIPTPIFTLQHEVKCFQATQEIIGITMGSNHIIYSVRDKIQLPTMRINLLKDVQPGKTSADLFPTIYNSLFNEQFILSSNSHVKMTYLFLYTGILPTISESSCKEFIGFLHSIRISIDKIEKKEFNHNETSTLRMSIYALLKKMEEAIEFQISKFISPETVSILLMSIDSLSGSYKPSETLFKEYSSFLKFCRKQGLLNCKDSHLIPSYMKVKMNELPVEEKEPNSILKKSNKKSKTIFKQNNYNVEQDLKRETFEVHVLESLWINIRETADCIIKYNDFSIIAHAWVLSLVSPILNKYITEKYISPDRSHYLASDDALVRSVNYYSKLRTSMFHWVLPQTKPTLINNNGKKNEIIYNQKSKTKESSIRMSQTNFLENNEILEREEMFVINFREILDFPVKFQAIREVIKFFYKREIEITNENARDIKEIWSKLQCSNNIYCQIMYVCDSFLKKKETGYV